MGKKWFHRYEIPNRTGGKYLTRWHILPRNKYFNIYLHKFHESDDTSLGLHDHPWNFVSIILKGYYYEWLPGRKFKFHPVMSVIRHKAEDKHAVVLSDICKPVWSLVFTGRNRRDWGFDSPEYGWISHVAVERGYVD